MADSFPYLIAIDGGGTRCRFAMTAPPGRIEVNLGSANVYSDRAAAVQALRSGLAALMEQAGLPQSALAEIPIYAGLAGVTDAQVAADVAGHLPSRCVEVEDDRRSAVVGALGPQRGCLIGVGTGSFLARQGAQGIRFIGGYGPMLGDEASGNWLGMHLLRRVLLHMDGIGAGSALVQSVRQRFGDDPMRIVAFSSASQPAQVAEFAPDIVAAADRGDPVAVDLMQEGAAYLTRGLRALGWQGDEPICAIGGVAPHYAKFLPQDVQNAFAQARGTPLDGALTLAHRLAERVKVGAP